MSWQAWNPGKVMDGYFMEIASTCGTVDPSSFSQVIWKRLLEIGNALAFAADISKGHSGTLFLFSFFQKHFIEL